MYTSNHYSPYELDSAASVTSKFPDVHLGRFSENFTGQGATDSRTSRSLLSKAVTNFVTLIHRPQGTYILDRTSHGRKEERGTKKGKLTLPIILLGH